MLGCILTFSCVYMRVCHSLQGSIFSCNRKAKNPVDRVKYVLNGHHGPIYGLRRNPFNSKYFLSIGDWTARVWTDDTAVKTPILTTKYHATYLTGGGCSTLCVFICISSLQSIWNT